MFFTIPWIVGKNAVSLKKEYICMPKIFEYFGFIFFFYSNEHEPIHVHVLKGELAMVFELILMNGELIEIRRRNATGHPSLTEKDIRTVEDFIHAYYKRIVKKWMDFFVLKKRIRCTEIKEKL